LLLEADYNTMNKILFNNRSIPILEQNKRISYKVTVRRRN